MLKINDYRDKIKKVLNRYASYKIVPRDVDTQVIIDIEKDHYLLIRAGWHNNESRDYGLMMHLDIIDDKIWIQYDGTEPGVANELADLGISKKDIVLAYHLPAKRQYTEFAIG